MTWRTHRFISVYARHTVLAGLLSAAGIAPTDAASFEVGTAQLDIPDWQVSSEGIHYAPTGFVLTNQAYTLVGDALRWDQEHDILFATGRIRFSLPGMVIHAESLGSRIGLRQGEAWNVTLWYQHGEIERRISARHLTWNDDQIAAHGVTGATGYGGLVSMAAQSLVIGRRPQPKMDEEGPGRHLSFIHMKHFRAYLSGIPVWYWPHMYRDFLRDYPWTRYRVNQNNRRGIGLDMGIGWRMAPLLGWHLRPQIEIDAFEKLGTGVTARIRGEHETLGKTEVLTWGVQHGPQRRNHWSYTGYDVAWQNQWHIHDHEDPFGPVGAAHLRWASLPRSWPGEHPKQLYHDLFDQDFAHRPLPRQGGSAALQWAHVGVSLDRAGFADEQIDQHERDINLALTIPTQRLFADVHGHAAFTTEQWTKNDEIAGRWFGGHFLYSITPLCPKHQASPFVIKQAFAPKRVMTGPYQISKRRITTDCKGNLGSLGSSICGGPDKILRPEIGWRYASHVLGDPLPTADWPMPRN